MLAIGKFVRRPLNFSRLGLSKATANLKIRGCFSNIEVRVPEPEDRSDSSKYKPENKLHFNEKGYCLLYEFKVSSPYWGLLFVGGVFLLVGYQLAYRWYKSNRFLNIACSLLIIPITIYVVTGVLQMYWSCKRISISRCGKKLWVQTFMNPFGRKINIRDIKEFKEEEKKGGMDFSTQKEKKEGEFEITTYKVVYGSGRKLKVHVSEEEDEDIFMVDKDLFRAVMNARECDFSNSN